MGYFSWFGEDKTKHLSHHGIKGQKWGVRRFQNKDGTRTALGKAHAQQARAYKAEKAGKGKDKEREGTSALSYYDNSLRALGTAYRFNRSKGMSSDNPEWHKAHEQDRADMRATREALINRKKFYDEYGQGALADLSGQGYNQITRHTQREQNGKMDWVAFDTATILGSHGERRTSEAEIKHAVETTNPHFKDGYGWQNNCPACSAVVTMKKMGYSDDLIASPLHDGASTTHGISQWFKGATTEEVGSIGRLEDAISGFGEGSFGAIGGSRYSSDTEGNSVRTSGHSMAFTNLGGGKIQVECGQSGKIYGSLWEAAEDQGFSMDKGFTVTRLDNTTPNFVNMAADGVLSTRNEYGNRSSQIVINNDDRKLHDDTEYYKEKHFGNHNFW